MEKDLVCGMTVKSGESAGKSDYQGHAYYFCSEACKESFDRKPEVYALQKTMDRERNPDRS